MNLFIETPMRRTYESQKQTTVAGNIQRLGTARRYRARVMVDGVRYEAYSNSQRKSKSWVNAVKAGNIPTQKITKL